MNMIILVYKYSAAFIAKFCWKRGFLIVGSHGSPLPLSVGHTTGVKYLGHSSVNEAL